MRRPDIKPGVIYAYQQYGRHPTAPAEPLMFLDFTEYGGGPKLTGPWQDTRGLGQHAFKKAGPKSRAQAGTVWNSGSVGYPAVLLPETSPTQEQLAALRASTLAEFILVTGPATSKGRQFLVVTSLARVTGPWPGGNLILR